MKSSTIIIIILFFLAAFTLASKEISSFVGMFEANGDFTYSFLEGDSPITHVSFYIDPKLVENIVVRDIPPGWSYTLEGATLTLDGGSIQPGSTIRVGYYLERYMEPREIPISATGLTADGDAVSALGTVVVTETIILKIIYIFIIYKIPILIGIMTLGTGIFIREKLKPTLKTTPIGTSVDIPRETDIPEKGIPTEIVAVCGCRYEWKHRFMQINVYPSSPMGGALTMRQLSDDPMPFKALAIDMYALIHICTCPTKEGERIGRAIYDFKANVRYEWSFDTIYIQRRCDHLHINNIIS